LQLVSKILNMSNPDPPMPETDMSETEMDIMQNCNTNFALKTKVHCV